MNRLALLLVALAAFPGMAASAQMVQIAGENLLDGGSVVASGSIAFAPTLCNGQPTEFTLGGTRHFSATPFLFSIVGGSIVNGLVPDTSQTVPHICFAAKAVNLATGGVILKTGYATMQPAPGAYWCSTAAGATTCNINAYQPSPTGGFVSAPNPSVTPPSGGVPASPITFTGDVTGTETTTIVATLPPIVAAQTAGDSTHVAQVTVSAKGLVTNVAAVPIAQPVMTWTTAGGCSLQTAGCAQSGQWTPSAAIVVTKIQIFLPVAPSGCANAGTLLLEAGGTALLSVPLTNGTESYTVPGPVNVAAGTVLSLQNSLTAAAGCSTYPTGVAATLEYRMQ